MVAASGADAVKFQTFKPEEEVTRSLQKVEYQKTGDSDQESYFEMIKKLEFDESQWCELMEYSAEKKILFLSTPSEDTSARLLQKLGVAAFKIGSNDLVTIPLLEEIAAWGKPIILSTGMATVDEVREALDAIAAKGNMNVVILQCTSSYPTPPAELNLRVVATLKDAFDCLVGFSDHSAGLVAAPLAVLLGASVVETHVTLDKNLPGPDQRMALDPQEFSKLVDAIRAVENLDADARQTAIDQYPDAEMLLGRPEKEPTQAELVMRTPTRKGIVARRDIKKGEALDIGMLAYKRPSGGLPPRRYRELLGRSAAIDIAQDSYIIESSLE
jgi:N,N'-diacetyllegionaminate synthase